MTKMIENRQIDVKFWRGRTSSYEISPRFSEMPIPIVQIVFDFTLIFLSLSIEVKQTEKNRKTTISVPDEFKFFEFIF